MKHLSTQWEISCVIKGHFSDHHCFFFSFFLIFNLKELCYLLIHCHISENTSIEGQTQFLADISNCFQSYTHLTKSLSNVWSLCSSCPTFLVKDNHCSSSFPIWLLISRQFTAVSNFFPSFTIWYSLACFSSTLLLICYQNMGSLQNNNILKTENTARKTHHLF